MLSPSTRFGSAMVNGADTAETDSDTEAVQEVAQQALGSGAENFVGADGAMREPSVVSNATSGGQGDDYSLVQVTDWAQTPGSTHLRCSPKSSQYNATYASAVDMMWMSPMV